MSDWDFRGCDTQYGTHGMHTYVASMIPQLARRLIEEYTVPGDRILDPFCGGGSVLVELMSSGRLAVGRDVNPLAVLISQAKTTPVDAALATWTLEQILGRVDRRAAPVVVDKELAYWFKPEHTGILASMAEVIESSSADTLTTFFQAVFSSTVRDVSLTRRNEVRLRRLPAEDIERLDVSPITRFEERARKAIELAAELPEVDTDIQIGNVQALDLEDASCDGLICSPPYGDERNGVSYTQFSKNMLAWLGYHKDAWKASQAKTLGWGRQERMVPASETLIKALDSIVAYSESVRQAIAFYADYRRALGEMVRVTRGPIIIVMGQRVLRDVVFDNVAITVELMRDIGVPLVDVFCRQLPSKRLPRMRQFGAAIDREAILVFRT